MTIVSIPGLVGRAYAYTESDGVYTLRPVWPSMIDTGRPGTGTLAKDYYKNYRDVSVDVTVNYAAGTAGETAAQVNAKNTVIKSGAAYITANGTTYIVDKDTKFVDVDENQVYIGFENVPDYIADSTVDGGKVSFWAIDTRSTDGVLRSSSSMRARPATATTFTSTPLLAPSRPTAAMRTTRPMMSMWTARSRP